MDKPLQHRLIELPKRVDTRGKLVFGQEGDHVPFHTKRFFLIYDVTGEGRGAHAHREQHEFLTMPSGSVTVTVDDGRTRTPVRLDRPDIALYVPPMLWLDLEDFSPGAVCLALASDLYSESDYIRDRDTFLRITRGTARE